MKMTKELRSRIDKNGHIIDFVFCFRCYKFLDINEYEDDKEIICRYRHLSDKVKWENSFEEKN